MMKTKSFSTHTTSIYFKEVPVPEKPDSLPGRSSLFRYGTSPRPIPATPASLKAREDPRSGLTGWDIFSLSRKIGFNTI